KVGRAVACIDVSEIPLGQLAGELTRAALSRAVPVLANAELLESGDRETARQLRQILRDYPGPLVLRMGLEGVPPLDPGFVEVALPALSETVRARVFCEALSAARIAADGAQLARRYKIAPGTIHRVVADARARIVRTDASPAQHDAIVDEAARQQLATRIGATAQRVTRLASWDQVSLPDEMLDSIRELIGRARHGRTVFDEWGYDERIATARGITALFYGPPGTGKTMVAGLIARELGLELYRVDLAKVMSKWIGETEKHLGELFDAAEDGRIMLLFDEADSLFAKRTEVKSSNDRYANLEVNFLLQRLDAFEGVAVLTTNLDGSIDPAFKRRLSMRMYFPLPDEELRAHLWAAHVTPRIPTAGILDFAALARRFPLSGGYIRNSALRAAFLAAQEGAALTQQHLERAVLLEYRELGKLADDGRLD
ncbi:MAG TPA: ATP-binding protein, partial [Kofleriaceae bacterium]